VELARIVVLSSSGTFAVFSLDVGRQLHAISEASWTTGPHSRLGRAIDVGWLPLPRPVGQGVVIMVALEGGALAVVNTNTMTQSLLDNHHHHHYYEGGTLSRASSLPEDNEMTDNVEAQAQEDVSASGSPGMFSLAPAPPCASGLLLPSW